MVELLVLYLVLYLAIRIGLMVLVWRLRSNTLTTGDDPVASTNTTPRHHGYKSEPGRPTKSKVVDTQKNAARACEFFDNLRDPDDNDDIGTVTLGEAAFERALRERA